ncbi:hypothetical protein M3223_18200 [Paenibacillus pasadenensis]|uniref:Ger(x)C family spore germination protein n=1 Tax=Paenibacillus pasadenensis TaxID=217090 RepID=UPI00203C4009|nr:Ger(x)C family spore germination C-terminal domain-containing protein [Paenibacillus pasadenensis]MCM3749293.1 hypothetical protein [Paenibacillus pasadenensis]
MKRCLCFYTCLAAGLLLLLAAAGCDSNEVNRVYVKTLGLDFKDGKYVMFVQVLNFNNEAKNESSPKSAGYKPWTGNSSSRSFIESANAILATSQRELDFSHVTALVISENFLPRLKTEDLTELLDKFPEIRLNIWTYATAAPMDQVFSTETLFNFMDTNSVLHSPEEYYKQLSGIEPVQLFKLLREDFHPAFSEYLPQLGTNNSIWESDFKSKNTLSVTGAYFLHNNNYKGKMSLKQLQGWHWMNPRMKRWTVSIYKDGEELGAITYKKSKPAVQLRFNENGEPIYNIDVKLYGFLALRKSRSPLSEVEQAAEDMITKQIREAYTTGIKREIDIFQLNELFYRKHYKHWKQMTSNGSEFILTENSLDKIKVKIKIIVPGRYKH